MKKIIFISVLFFIFVNSCTVIGQWISNITYTPTGGQSIYDLQSNASAQHLWLDNNNPGNIHTIFISASYNDTLFTNRRVKYYFSSDYGTTWSYISDVSSYRSGFGAITVTSDGSALVAIQASAPPGITRTIIYADAFPGLGSFYALDPGYSRYYLYPKITATQSILLPQKFVFITGGQSDSVFSNVGLSLFSPSFVGYQSIPAKTLESYSIATSSNGKIGIAYISNSLTSANEIGNVYFVESNNNGITFSTPLKIFQSTVVDTNNILGAYRGISLCYQGISPKVVFETVRQKTNGSYYPGLSSQIRFWSNILPGNDPFRSKVIADSTNIPFAPVVGVNDVLAPLCRPVIGSTTDSSKIFVAFMAAVNQTGGTGIQTNYNDVYLTFSPTGGLSFKTPLRLNPLVPRFDWTYPSIASLNYHDNNFNYIANLAIQRDSIPGSYVNGSLNGRSLAQQIFVKVTTFYESVPQIPYPPILLFPPNGSQNQPRNPVFKWYQVWNAASYRFQLATDTGFVSLVKDTAGISNLTLSLPVGFLNPNVNYYWRLNATNPFGNSNWSDRWSFKTDTSTVFSVSGNIKYADNNQIVTSGYVKAIKLDTLTGNIITLDSTGILANGSYSLRYVHRASVYIKPYPNSGQGVDNFIPTYYPSSLLWENATQINISSNLTGIDVSVIRINQSQTYNMIEGYITKTNLLPTGSPLAEALVYARYGNDYKGFAISGNEGRYTLNYMPPGNLKIFVNRLGYNTDSMSVYLATNLNSINFVLSPVYTGIQNIISIIPDRFNLYQNYPNPFNPETRIKFDVAGDLLHQRGFTGIPFVSIRIFDITGREIQTLVNMKLSPGTYEVLFNGKDLSSGVYFYQLRVSNINGKIADYIETKRMVMIK